jgi:hypothetical protein
VRSSSRRARYGTEGFCAGLCNSVAADSLCGARGGDRGHVIGRMLLLDVVHFATLESVERTSRN